MQVQKVAPVPVRRVSVQPPRAPGPLALPSRQLQREGQVFPRRPQLPVQRARRSEAFRVRLALRALVLQLEAQLWRASWVQPVPAQPV